MPPAKVAARSASVREYTKTVERERVELHPHLKRSGWIMLPPARLPPGSLPQRPRSSCRAEGVCRPLACATLEVSGQAQDELQG